MKLRDLLAVPFWALATILDLIAVTIGGTWTSEMYTEQTKRLSKNSK